MDWLKAHKTQVQQAVLIIILVSSVILFVATQSGVDWLAIVAFILVAGAFTLMGITP